MDLPVSAYNNNKQIENYCTTRRHGLDFSVLDSESYRLNVFSYPTYIHIHNIMCTIGPYCNLSIDCLSVYLSVYVCMYSCVRFMGP